MPVAQVYRLNSANASGKSILFMKVILGKFGLLLFLGSGMAAAFSAPAQGWQDEQGARVERQMQWAWSSQARRDDGGYQGYGNGGGNGGRGAYDGRNGRGDPFRNGSQQQQGGYWQAPQDDGRRGSRMSPEERRELRRQIDEAGRNIYAPGRR